MTEVAVKTHLIIKDIHSEYDINWCGKFRDVDPFWVDDKPVFVIITNTKRVELNTFDMKEIERVGRLLTEPRGRQAITSDRAHIYIKDAHGDEKLMGVITHKKVKTFAPMYDKVGLK